MKGQTRKTLKQKMMPMKNEQFRTVKKQQKNKNMTLSFDPLVPGVH